MPANSNKHARGIYLLPNLLTTAGLFSGFYAIVAAIRGDFDSAATAIFVAIVMDGLDGRIARITNTQSNFGAEYDSLADVISFCLAPALVIYQWSLLGIGKLGWMIAFIYAACGALRLARFNTQTGIIDKRYFQGLPSPAAAACIASWVWLGIGKDISSILHVTIAALLTFFCAILMVSTVRYHSFKELNLRARVPFIVMLAMVLLFAFIGTDAPLILFSCSALYVLSGLVMTLFRLRQHRLERQQDK